MKQQQSHHLWARLRLVSPWFFLILTLVLAAISVASLRANNEHMVKLRDAVYAADKNDGDVSGALKNLQNYVVNHMNTDLTTGVTSVYPPIQLKYTYQRLEQAQSDALSATNTTLYTTAQQYCEQQVPTGFSGSNRIGCIEQYLTSHGIQTVPTAPDPGLYQFDFVSARWSPDRAGFSVLATALSGLAFVVSLIVLLVRKLTHK